MVLSNRALFAHINKKSQFKFLSKIMNKKEHSREEKINIIKELELDNTHKAFLKESFNLNL